MSKLTARQEQELRDAFNLFDNDRSGTISKYELKRVLTALSVKVTDQEVQRLLGMMDTDHSGDIDYQEFKRVMGDVYFRKHSQHELATAFKKFDTDGSGYISTKELQDIISKMGRHLTRHEVEAMIKTIDTNNDGKISFDEFCSLFD